MTLDRSQYPQELNHPAVKGVFTGGCVERGEGSRFRAKAHSHERGLFTGWICFLSAKRLTIKELCLHELAHLISPGGHNNKWRKTLLAIGGTLDATPELKSYHKKSRKLMEVK